ncbi:hypothetical protein [Mangrovicella endophytica]|uniref:hypothetical protein n=1 Tax=Mangrovicella endophytica TaxID=2066697 RepID=UPI0013000555|nr:hypothetical protein [Mangrovicella endophytica]
MTPTALPAESDDSAVADAFGGQLPTGGMIVGRPDLSDDVVIEAIAMQLAVRGRSPDGAARVLERAKGGDAAALKFMRTLVLPPPQARLSMPLQIIRNERRREAGRENGVLAFARLPVRRR